MATKSAAPRERFEIHGALDARAAEALRLELVWLARRHGVELEDFVVEPVAPRPPSASRGDQLGLSLSGSQKLIPMSRKSPVAVASCRSAASRSAAIREARASPR